MKMQLLKTIPFIAILLLSYLFSLSNLFIPNLIAPNIAAAQRNYTSHIATADWSVESNEQFYCKIKQKIPMYGEAIFIRKSGHDMIFNLQSKDFFLSESQIIILAEQAPWRHDNSSFEIGQFKLEKGHKSLIVKSPYASRMFQHIENGMMPSILYKDKADQRDLIYIAISPMKFRKSLEVFRNCEATLLTYDREKILDFTIFFASNKTDLSKKAKLYFDDVLKHLSVDKGIKQIRIDAHADERGRRRFNDKLSEARADAIRDYLVKIGISEKLIYSEAHGEREPKFDNKTKLGRSKNRNARIQMLKMPPPPPKDKSEAKDKEAEINDKADYIQTDNLNTPVPSFINLDYLNK